MYVSKRFLPHFGGDVSAYKVTSFLEKLPFLNSRLDHHMMEVMTGAASAFVWRTLGAVAAFASNMVLVRLLGADGFGAYTIAFTAAIFASTIGTAGLDQTLVRFIAIYAANGDTHRLKSTFVKGALISSVVSLFAAMALFFLSPLLSIKIFKEPDLTLLMRIMSLVVVPLSLINVIAASLQALKRIRESIILQAAVPPLLNIAFLLVINTTSVLTPAAATAAYFISTAIVFFIGLLVWRYHLPQSLGTSDVVISVSELMNVALPMAVTSLMILIITVADTLILGIFVPPNEVGVYNAALKLAMVSTFAITAVSAISMPKFAALYASGDTKAIEVMIKHSVRIMFLFVSPFLLVSVFAPSLVMRVYGGGFGGGAVSLAILSAGQAVFIAFGLGGNLLLMTGKEVAVRNIIFLTSGANVLLSFILIPYWGGEGAAVAHAVSYGITALLYLFAVKKHLNITLNPF